MALGDWLKDYSKDLKNSQTPESYSRIAEDLEGKKVDDWGINTFLRYFYKLRAFKWADLEQSYSGRYLGNMKAIIASCSDNKEVKKFIDNVILNFDAIREKHWQFKKAEFPSLEQIIYNKEILLKDVRDSGGTTSRSHRVSKTNKPGENKPLW